MGACIAFVAECYDKSAENRGYNHKHSLKLYISLSSGHLLLLKVFRHYCYLTSLDIFSTSLKSPPERFRTSLSRRKESAASR